LLQSRIGIIVPRHKQSAVARNRVKRRLRELTRTTLLPALVAAPPRDIVLRAGPEAYGVDHDALAVDMGRIVTRLGSGAP